MSKIKNVLFQYFQNTTTDAHLDELVNNSLLSIGELSKTRNQQKYRWLSLAWYLSSISAGFSFVWLLIDLKNSGALSLINMLVDRFSVVTDNWQDYLLSFTDLMPIYSLVAVMLSIAVLVILNKEKRRFSVFKFNQFVI